MPGARTLRLLLLVSVPVAAQNPLYSHCIAANGNECWSSFGTTARLSTMCGLSGGSGYPVESGTCESLGYTCGLTTGEFEDAALQLAFDIATLGMGFYQAADEFGRCPTDKFVYWFEESCERSTGGTCTAFSTCEPSRNAVCEGGECVCPEGQCNVEGQCVSQGSCPKSTWGSCWVAPCDAGRNATCSDGLCQCGEDQCAVDGQCLMKPSTELPTTASPTTTPPTSGERTTCGALKDRYKAEQCCGQPAKPMEGLPLTCGEFKGMYKSHECCGNPSKEVPLPGP